ncbi:MAG: outer membrane beta-barrel protein [Bacteroidales bacterium]|jgi:hypothetical protein|nr:outer membrane beta-barrel protein [Bacteroidales bacterium]
MKKRLFFIMIGFSLISSGIFAQNIYPVTGGEMIFSQSTTSFTQDFLDQYPDARVAADNVRWTVFFHFGQYIHYDVNDKFGLYSGLGVRNVGMITDETLPQTVSEDTPYEDYKIIRRQYLLGLPLAVKFGSFDKHFYFYGGGEIELAVAFKEKYWTGSFDRDDSKTKSTKWFANQTPTFLPSFFAGVQLPGGVNLKFKYYLNDFLDTDYRVSSNSNEGSSFSVSDLSRYKESQVFYVSVSWQFNTAEMFGY